MITIRNNTFSLSQKVFMFAILVTPFAYDIASIRANDILVLLASFLLLLSKDSISRDIFISFFVCFSILIFSIFLGFVLGLEITVNRVVFFYKYLAIFLVILLCKEQFLDEIFLKRIAKVYFIVLMILSVWTYIYLILIVRGLISGDIRPSFPFSRDYFISDAHLYSSTLAMMFSAYLLFIRKFLNHSVLRTLILSAIIFISIILTGSRGGLLMTVMTILLILFSYFLKILIRQSLSFKTLSLFGFIIFILVVAFLVYGSSREIDLSVLSTVFNRATNFDLANDESSNFRVIFFKAALSDLEKGYFLLGIGPLSSSKDFFDGIISILMSHGGLTLLYFFFILMLYVYYVILNNNSLSMVSKINLCFLVFLYIFSNVITEYVFVMRNMILSIVGIYISFYFSKNKNSFKVGISTAK